MQQSAPFSIETHAETETYAKVQKRLALSVTWYQFECDMVSVMRPPYLYMGTDLVHAAEQACFGTWALTERHPLSLSQTFVEVANKVYDSGI